MHAARLTPEVARSSIHVEGDLLTAVRVAQNHAGVVRVALDVNGVKEYTALLTKDPTQLVIDLYGNSFAAESVRTASAKRAEKAGAEDSRPTEAAAASPTRDTQTVAAKPPGGETGPASEQWPGANSKSVSIGTLGRPNAAANSTPSPRDTLPSAKSRKSTSFKTSAPDAKPDLIRPASAPQPLRDGQSTLTRTLGLKIGRIVIDPGHGGHDTGTIGPTGLMEKDLCLDVALRLGKIIEQRLPGADVVYTRSDDTFVPLEERTAPVDRLGGKTVPVIGMTGVLLDQRLDRLQPTAADAVGLLIIPVFQQIPVRMEGVEEAETILGPVGEIADQRIVGRDAPVHPVDAAITLRTMRPC